MGRRAVLGRCAGVRIRSDAGDLLLRAVDQRLGLTARRALGCVDHRHPASGKPRVEALAAQRLACWEPCLPVPILTLTRDSKLQGPTTWCAAWHGLTGEVLGPGPGRPRPQEFLPYLDRAFSRDRTLHGILDHSATPQHQTVR